MKGMQIIPGGESGVPGSPLFANMLRRWLANEFHDALFSDQEVASGETSREEFSPQE
jgi:acyl-homoserine lactone acylase PvdQ